MRRSICSLNPTKEVFEELKPLIQEAYTYKSTKSKLEFAEKEFHCMIDELVVEYLSLLDKMRNGYEDSLGIASQILNVTFNKIISTIPEIFRAIYGKVAGTYRNTENQKFMDFLPGLIHINELESEYHTLLQMLVSVKYVKPE